MGAPSSMIEHGIVLDHDRERRIGFDEAIFAESKSIAQLEAIAAQAIEARLPRLFTRLDAIKYEALATPLRKALDFDPVSRTAILGQHAKPQAPARVAIVTGGSSDLPASREALRTLEYYGQASLHIPDVGVAGLWRLLERVEEFRPMH